ncbi:GtrA family protein [Pseudomonas fluorescens]|uniref:GtrA family protein n=1 Tax=Pseudomonas fluorescens TaxID=294 RepID=UPI00123F3336|nr:GtrA family protein [Pseudomonas fluorescens]
MKTFFTPSIVQLIRYGVVGVLNNFVLYLGYLVLVSAGVGAKLSMTLMYLTGVAVGFLANRNWTFKHGKGRGALIRYVQMHVTGYFLNFLLLFTFVDVLRYPHQVVQALSIIVVAIFGFFMCKYYVFRFS